MRISLGLVHVGAQASLLQTIITDSYFLQEILKLQHYFKWVTNGSRCTKINADQD